jgi:hypothetical protein
MGASPLIGKFRRRFNPPPFGNFRKHLTLFRLEISKKKDRRNKKYELARLIDQFAANAAGVRFSLPLSC